MKIRKMKRRLSRDRHGLHADAPTTVAVTPPVVQVTVTEAVNQPLSELRRNAPDLRGLQVTLEAQERLRMRRANLPA